MSRLRKFILFSFLALVAARPASAAISSIDKSFNEGEQYGGTFAADLMTDLNELENSINNIVAAQIDPDVLTETEMADDINPRIRTYEGASCEYVDDGLLPVAGASLTQNTSAGTAYPRGFRIDKTSATSKTYTASKWTFVDLDQNGDFQYSEVTIGAATPSIASNALRLARVSTDGTTVASVQDLRTTSCATGPFDVITDAAGEGTLEHLLSTGSPRKFGNVGYKQGWQASFDNATATSFYVKDGAGYINGKYRTTSGDSSVPQTNDDPVNEVDGLDSGSIAASTKYFIYAVADAAGDPNASITYSTNASTPAGVTNYRYIGQIYTDPNSRFTSRDTVMLNDYGKVIQSVYDQNSQTVAATTTTPFDDTTPTSSEGTALMTSSIDAVTVGNRILIEAKAYFGATSSTVRSIGAIYRGSETAALSGCVSTCAGTFTGGGAYSNLVAINCETRALATSRTTYTLRVGPSSAATIYFNGDNGGRTFGGSYGSYMRLTEVEQ